MKYSDFQTREQKGFLVPQEVISTRDEFKAIISAENLSLSYNQRKAFSDISLSFAKGKITAIVGPSGCGKSSFLMCINRMIDIIPGAEPSGKLFFEATELLSPSLDLKPIRKKIGMIFQKPNPFPVSIRNNIIRTLKEHRIGTNEEQEEILQSSLEEVGLWNEVKDRLNAPALALSGGQQQRLCLARALILKPQVILLDEPCSALDPISSAVVEKLILNLRERYTIVMVTHNLAQAKRIADYIGVFWMKGAEGTLIEFGASNQIINAPKSPITKAYFNGLEG